MIRVNIPYYKSHNPDKQSAGERKVVEGVSLLDDYKLFAALDAVIYLKGGGLDATKGAAKSAYGERIFCNSNLHLSAEEWAHVIAHCMLHNYFGHYDKDKMPDDGNGINIGVWNKACDIYVERFLRDVRLGMPIADDPAKKYRFKMDDEVKIYERLIHLGDDGENQEYGTAGLRQMDMAGLNNPVCHPDGRNPYVEQFGNTLSSLTASAVVTSGGHAWDEKKDSSIIKAARWFISHYPLLGGIAASFKIIEDYSVCEKNEVQIAAVNIYGGEIYTNPASGYNEEEWKFILAHEFLHAGLQHDIRCQGRNAYIWNCAVDYVVNGWLKEMEIGIMPEGVLYDEKFKNVSAETVYDILMSDIRRSLRLQTLRGYHKGDLMKGTGYSFGSFLDGLDMDEYYRSALEQGLEYHQMERGRGYIPAGLIQEIRALAVPPIGWKVKLAEWFQERFPLEEKQRSYARPSRRQSATPDIPRPGYRENSVDANSRTFGVVVDTSGSVSNREIGMALGAIASYAVSREVRFVRVVFCDADAYDCGYMSAEDIAGRVEIKGRGGTELQPAVNLLENADDFPPQAPILLITDGEIEKRIMIHRDHAWLLPKHCKLPFKTNKPVFQFE